MATILDGRATQDKIRDELRVKISSLKGKGVCPGLGIVQVGKRKDSDTYIRMKGRACKDLGIHFEHLQHNDDVSKEKLIESIWKLNEDDDIHGIIVQLPLPSNLDENDILSNVCFN